MSLRPAEDSGKTLDIAEPSAKNVPLFKSLCEFITTLLHRYTQSAFLSQCFAILR